MKTAVVGCGGIGGVIAGALALHRHDVSCIDADRKIIETLHEKGLRIRGRKGEFTVHPGAFTTLHESHSSFDLIIIAVKSGVLPIVLDEAVGHLCGNGIIATTQNGLGILDLAPQYPGTRVAAGAVGFNAIRVGYDHYRVTAEGGITFGSLNGATRDDILLIQGLLNPTIRVEVTGNITGALWSKLIIVCGVTGLGGISGMPVGAMLNQRIARRLFYRIMSEGVRVSAKPGVELAPFGGGTIPSKFTEDGLPLPLRYIIMKLVGMRYRSLIANIQVDLERGKKTEVDHLNGEMVRRGREAGVDTPVNEGIVRMTHEIEDGKRTMGMHNLEELHSLL
jgi:2-dehydropantoate 2-reductase